MGDGVVPLQGDHSCNIKGTVSREWKTCKIDQEVALQDYHSCNIQGTVSRERNKRKINQEAARGSPRSNIPLSPLDDEQRVSNDL